MASTSLVSDSQLEAFHRRGFLVLRGVLSRDEIASFRRIFRDYVMDRREGMSTAEQTMGGSATRTIFTIGEAPVDVTQFLTSPRLGEIAARLMDTDAVRFLNFYGFFKPAGAPPTPWHQDHSYVPLDTDKMLTIWSPLHDVTPEMGGLVYAEGSHEHGALGPEDARRFRLIQGGALAPGDVTIHTGWLLHFALANTTDHMREAFAVSYYADGARIRIPRMVPFMQVLLDGCFAGLGPGDVAAGPANPVVYRRDGASQASIQGREHGSQGELVWRHSTTQPSTRSR
jgi:ectoine hydroxylase-related dioxygenase (phytanoyl-CoA dioxygenase family)